MIDARDIQIKFPNQVPLSLPQDNGWKTLPSCKVSIIIIIVTNNKTSLPTIVPHLVESKAHFGIQKISVRDANGRDVIS